MSMSILAPIPPEALAAHFNDVPHLSATPRSPRGTSLNPQAFQTRPFERMRRVRGLLSDRPRSLASISVELGLKRDAFWRALRLLVDAGLALRIGEGRYVARGPARPVPAAAQVPPEVGRQILACLTEPRRPREIAWRIGRSGCCTTGHLRHLMRRGLVVRLERGIYALAQCGPASGVAGPCGNRPSAAG